MRWASSGVPMHLVPFHFNHTHLCPVSSSCHVFILLSLARAHVHICPHLSFTPSRGEACVCVPLVVTGILLNCILVILSRGTAWLVTVAVQRRGCYKSLIWILDAESTYLLGCGVDKLSLQSSRKGPMSSADVHGPPSSCRSDFVVLVLSLLASLPLTDPQAR